MAEQMVRVTNKSDRKITVSWDGTPYELEPGASDVLAEVVGNHFVKYHGAAVETKVVEAKYEEPEKAGRDEFTDPATGQTFATMTEFVAFIEERARLGVVAAGAEAEKAGDVPADASRGEGNSGVLASPKVISPVVTTPGLPAGGGRGSRDR